MIDRNSERVATVSLTMRTGTVVREVATGREVALVGEGDVYIPVADVVEGGYSYFIGTSQYFTSDVICVAEADYSQIDFWDEES